MRRRIAIGAAALAALALAACSESRQEKFEKAMRAAEVARSALDSAEEELDAREADAAAARETAAEAESALDAARRQQEAAAETLESARAEVARWADDVSVTRALQRRLLEERALEGAAVAARVEQGVALLEGTAPNEAARERAIEIARETPGVADVRSGIAVPATDAEPEPAQPAEPEPAPIESFEATEPFEAPLPSPGTTP